MRAVFNVDIVAEEPCSLCDDVSEFEEIESPRTRVRSGSTTVGTERVIAVCTGSESDRENVGSANRD